MSANKVDVSVVIPIYNCESFLEEAIKSVLNQNIKCIELILVNDGSTDRSALICEKYVVEHAHIHYFYQSNSGVSVARNKGLLEATGSYVFFLDADDTMENTFLKNSFDIAISSQSDIVVVGAHSCSRFPNIMALPTWGMLLKREFLQQYPEVRFPVGIQPCEDGLFSHQLLALTTQISLSPNSSYYYRQHDDQNHNIINQNSDKVLDQIPIWFNILKNFYTKYNLHKSHALHLALFIEHEPFELRYLKMSLNNSQRERLFGLIRVFMNDKVLPFLTENDKKKLSFLFRYFLSANTYQDFEEFYRKCEDKKIRKIKLKLFLLKFVPFSKKKTLRLQSKIGAKNN
ncbi:MULTISPECIES: glycosyltransferase family 2 protein [unclassified Sphingobacterium]|uniref:glycosyltransferase family 2 protein n=1 Tax=unclassified Sphingobacterium TaxID=2609468 RepID=UPI00143AC4EB|nr:glycosyltransferase family A protein [Sphingobacterium sp. B16(2022)]NJI74519.1 glycosyltransferase family 2 protein [Sphingobacterium sp. B16(2022)]